MTRLAWRRGDAALRGALERWSRGALAEQVLADSPRRRLARLSDPAAGELLIKQFRVGSGRHRLRELAKRRLGRGQAEREERALRALRGAGVAVPEPLGLALREDGDALLALRFVDGAPLDAALAAAPPARRRLLARLGETVAALHRAGWIHADLHRGNVLVAGGAPLLLDVQRARRNRSAAARHADLGQLDYSLWGRASLADRIRLRAAALGLERPFDAAARGALRAVGRAAEQRADAHARSRTRRALRSGRAQAAARVGSLRGLRVRELDAESLAALVSAHAAAHAAGDARVLQSDARARLSRLELGELRVVVKEGRYRGLARGLADAVRGSAGRRAWRAGHGLLARKVGAARPLAFLEERRLGIPVRSLVVLEDLRPAPDALEASARQPEAVALALAGLALALHRRGVDHGDLKCTNVYLAGAPPFSARLVDLEGVRFRGRLSDRLRIEGLAQLNASLPDAVPAEARRRAFARYCAALPFERPRPDVLAEIAARSLARRHRWSGADCDCAAATSRPSPR
jgi:tRNA A-37 threonylcarbamoyl transferase component Bud32